MREEFVKFLWDLRWGNRGRLRAWTVADLSNGQKIEVVASAVRARMETQIPLAIAGFWNLCAPTKNCSVYYMGTVIIDGKSISPVERQIAQGHLTGPGGLLFRLRSVDNVDFEAGLAEIRGGNHGKR